jgi:hypothetical protein
MEANETIIHKQEQLGKNTYIITVNLKGHDVTLYENGEVLLTSMSMNKVDAYYNDLTMYIAP